MNNPDHVYESLETIFWVQILKFFDADPGWKKFGSGINIPDPQHCSERRKSKREVRNLNISGSVGRRRHKRCSLSILIRRIAGNTVGFELSNIKLLLSQLWDDNNFKRKAKL
jgi:hypothetical protein